MRQVKDLFIPIDEWFRCMVLVSWYTYKSCISHIWSIDMGHEFLMPDQLVKHRISWRRLGFGSFARTDLLERRAHLCMVRCLLLPRGSSFKIWTPPWKFNLCKSTWTCMVFEDVFVSGIGTCFFFRWELLGCGRVRNGCAMYCPVPLSNTQKWPGFIGA